MTAWEYRWRRTYFVETGRTEGYVSYISYAEVWKPDVHGDGEVPFPDDQGLNHLGTEGWELVAVDGEDVTLLNRRSPQNDDYGTFRRHTMIFKRPVETNP